MKAQKRNHERSPRTGTEDQAEDSEAEEFGEDYATVLYLCAMILKYHGDGQVKQLAGTGADGEDMLDERPEQSGAQVRIEQLSQNRDIQEDIVHMAKNLGIFVLLPVLDVAAAPQDFSFTAAPGGEAAEHNDEELGFALDKDGNDLEEGNDLGKLSESEDTAEYNMFLQNSLSRIEAREESEGDINADAKSQSFDLAAEVDNHRLQREKDAHSQTPKTDVADNSAIFNYLERQYSPGPEEPPSPELAMLGQPLLKSGIVEAGPIALSLQQKIA